MIDKMYCRHDGKDVKMERTPAGYCCEICYRNISDVNIGIVLNSYRHNSLWNRVKRLFKYRITIEKRQGNENN